MMRPLLRGLAGPRLVGEALLVVLPPVVRAGRSSPRAARPAAAEWRRAVFLALAACEGSAAAAEQQGVALVLEIPAEMEVPSPCPCP